MNIKTLILISSAAVTGVSAAILLFKKKVEEELIPIPENMCINEEVYRDAIGRILAEDEVFGPFFKDLNNQIHNYAGIDLSTPLHEGISKVNKAIAEAWMEDPITRKAVIEHLTGNFRDYTLGEVEKLYLVAGDTVCHYIDYHESHEESENN